MALQRRSQSQFIPDTVFTDYVPQFVERPDVTGALDKIDEQVNKRDVVSAALSEVHIKALPAIKDKTIQAQFSNLQTQIIDSAYADPDPWSSSKRITRAAIATQRMLNNPASEVYQTNVNAELFAKQQEEIAKTITDSDKTGRPDRANIFRQMNLAAYRAGGGVMDEEGNLITYDSYYRPTAVTEANDVLPEDPDNLVKETYLGSEPLKEVYNKNGVLGFNWASSSGVTIGRAQAAALTLLSTDSNYENYQKEKIIMSLYKGEQIPIDETMLALTFRDEGMTDEEWQRYSQNVISNPLEGIEDTEGSTRDEKVHNWLNTEEGQNWLNTIYNVKKTTDAVTHADRYTGIKVKDQLRLITDPSFGKLKEERERLKGATLQDTLIGNEMQGLAENVVNSYEAVETAESVLNNALNNQTSVAELDKRYNDNNIPEEYDSFMSYLEGTYGNAVADAYQTLHEARAYQESLSSITKSVMEDFNPTISIWDMVKSSKTRNSINSWMKGRIESNMSTSEVYAEIDNMSRSKLLALAGIEDVAKQKQRVAELIGVRVGDVDQALQNRNLDDLKDTLKRDWNEYQQAYQEELENRITSSDAAFNINYLVPTGNNTEVAEIVKFFEDNANIGLHRDVFSGVEADLQTLFAEKHNLSKQAANKLDMNTVKASVASNQQIITYKVKDPTNSDKTIEVHTYAPTQNMSRVRDYHKANVENKIGILSSGEKLSENETRTLNASLVNLSQYYDSSGNLFNYMLNAKEFSDPVEFEDERFQEPVMQVTKEMLNGEPVYQITYPDGTQLPGGNITNFVDLKLLLGIERKVKEYPADLREDVRNFLIQGSAIFPIYATTQTPPITD